MVHRAQRRLGHLLRLGVGGGQGKCRNTIRPLSPYSFPNALEHRLRAPAAQALEVRELTMVAGASSAPAPGCPAVSTGNPEGPQQRLDVVLRTQALDVRRRVPRRASGRRGRRRREAPRRAVARCGRRRCQLVERGLQDRVLLATGGRLELAPLDLQRRELLLNGPARAPPPR